MTADQPGEGSSSAPQDPPATGVSSIDEATATLADLADAPVTEHLDRLASVHAALEDALHPDQPV